MYRSREVQEAQELMKIRGEELLSVQSPFQSIVFEKTQRGLTLFLNDEIQFAESYERGYHHALAGSAMLRLPGARKVLILGGGDGLAARTIHEHNPMTQVCLAELDPVMVDVCRTFPPMAYLNKGALNSTVNMLGDAKKSIQAVPDKSVDMVLSDFPDYSMTTMSLYEPRMYAEMARIIKPGGVLSVYPGGNEPDVLGMVRRHFAHVTMRKTDIGDGLQCHIIQGVKPCLH